MLEVKITSKFKKDYKLIKKRKLDVKLLKQVVFKIANEIPLDEKHKNHELTGKYKGFRECHIHPDWLLIYLIEDQILTLTLTRTGSHSDLF